MKYRWSPSVLVGQKFEPSGKTVTINDQQNQEVNSRISCYDKEDLQDACYQIDPPLFLFSDPLSKKPSIKFLCDQKSLELKNDNQGRSSRITRKSSLDGFLRKLKVYLHTQQTPNPWKIKKDYWALIEFKVFSCCINWKYTCAQAPALVPPLFSHSFSV